MPTAILIDGDFFLRRYRRLKGKNTPNTVAKDLHRMCLLHLTQDRYSSKGHLLRKDRRNLYRIFFYDCPPLKKKVQNPVVKRTIDLSKTSTALWRDSFHQELKKLRKVALRLGYIHERSGGWLIRHGKVKDLLRGNITLAQITEGDVYYDVEQKGVDMRIGLDIASLAYKKQVDQIILVSGDSDFVPAAKLARSEGVDFILDPMWAPIREDLHEHIDGLRSIFLKPITNQNDTLLGSPVDDASHSQTT
jgi:uncharacterized LabA/DUF88 family protein